MRCIQPSVVNAEDSPTKPPRKTNPMGLWVDSAAHLPVCTFQRRIGVRQRILAEPVSPEGAATYQPRATPWEKRRAQRSPP